MDRIDDIMMLFDEMDIEMADDTGVKVRNQETTDSEILEEEGISFDYEAKRISDPVQMYLKGSQNCLRFCF